MPPFTNYSPPKPPRMKKVIFLLVIAFSNVCCFAQEACGFDHFLSVLKSDSTAGSDFDSVRLFIRNRIAENKRQAALMRTQPNNYVIPVVVHLVGSNASAMTDAQVQAQINLLNDGFANLLGSTYGSIADDAQIKFCLAQTLPNGQPWANVSAYNANLYYNTTAGITRCTTAVANTVAGNHNMNATGANSQQALVNVAYNGFSFNSYMNIWVVDQISQVPSPYVNSVIGYAPFPLLGPAAYLDGVVMRLDGFGIGSTGTFYNQGRILIHEAGHYLGLFHTFQFGCSEVINGTPCNLSGDECCDTPPVAAPNQTSCSALSASPPNSCSESPNLPDMYENHMDYAYDQPGTCRNTFTEDQADRMHATIQAYRANLVSFSNHIVTGLTQPTGCQANAIDPTFITTLAGGSQQLCTGAAIGFLAGSGASSYSWNFPGGTPSSASGTNNPTGIVYATPGTYNVTLNITDGLGNNYSSMMQIFVTNCTPYSGNRANWYFGKNASVSFATGIAVAQNPSSIVTDEASAAVSDNSGNLLFYTNGRSVWNNTHATMTNGAGTLNGSNNALSAVSTSQGVLIVPKPGTSDHYYIYTQSDVSSPTQIIGVSQYEVDMSVPGGMVMSTTPVNPSENYASNESQIAVPHCNGTDYWLIVKPKNNSQSGLVNPGPVSPVNNQIAAYRISGTGISNVPVLSSSGPYVPSATYSGGNNGITQMAISPDKKLYCLADIDAAAGYIYYFDCETGIFNHIATVTGIDGYGLAFSPNSKVLYAKASMNIRQYDLSALSPCNTTPPYIDIPMLPVGYGAPIFFFNSIQQGPDGRVYVGRAGYPASPQQFLGVINFPNVLNTTPTSNECGYNFSGIPLLSTQGCRLDLPNDIIGQIGAPADDFTFCVKNCGEACFTTLGCGTTFSWDFGDGNNTSGTNTVVPAGTNGGTTTGNFEYPCHTYASPGTYVVSLSVDGHTAVTHTVTITLPAPPTITGPLCPVTGLQQSYYGPAGYTYSWTASNASPTTGNTQTFNTTWITLPASLTLTVTDPATGCTATSTLAIATGSTTTVTVSPSTSTICAGATQTLCASGASSYTWSTGANTACITVSPTAPLTVYTVTGSNGACGTGVATASVYTTPGPQICLTASTSVCSNTCTVLNGICDDTDLTTVTYTWSPPGGIASVNSGSTVACPKVTTVYTLTATNLAGCTTVATTTVFVLAAPVLTISPITSTICAGTTQTICVAGASTYTWSTGVNTACMTDAPVVTTVYTVTGTNGNTQCKSTATSTVVVNRLPRLCMSSSPTICAGSCTVITAACLGSTDSYTWAPTTGLSSPYSGSTTACPTVTTIYTVTAVNAAGCVRTATLQVNVTPQPTVSVSPSTYTICAGNSQMLCASVGLSTYTWNPGGISSGCITVSPGSTTVYTVQGTKNGCTSTAATATVYVNPKPVLCMSSSVTICSGTCTVIRAKCDNTPAGTTYTWTPTTGLGSPNSGTSTACPTVTTTYTVNVTGPTGCTASSAVTVSVTPVPSLTVSPLTSTICAGSTQTICASGASTYTWSTGATSSCITVTPGVTTSYTVTGSNGNCPGNQVVATVTVVPRPSLCMSPSTTLCAGSCTTISGSCGLGKFVTYQWSPATGLSTPTSVSTTACPTVTTVYTLTATNLMGCVSTGTVLVAMSPATIAISGPASVGCGTSNLYSVAPVVTNPTTNYSWSATNATPASGFGTSASISFAAPGGVITWNASTIIGSQICKAKATFTVHCSFIPNPPIDIRMNSGDGTSIYPNPNTGVMTLAYAVDQAAIFEIMDANQKVVARYDLDPKERERIIRQEELTNGVYLYKVSVNNRIIKTGKIVIIR